MNAKILEALDPRDGRWTGKFERVYPDEITDKELELLQPVCGLEKANQRLMMQNINSGAWWLWRFPKPGKGIGVVFPDGDRLFVYYLRGEGFFASILKRDLLEASSLLGLKGWRAQVVSKGMLKSLKRMGYRVVHKFDDGPRWELELD